MYYTTKNVYSDTINDFMYIDHVHIPSIPQRRLVDLTEQKTGKN